MNRTGLAKLTSFKKLYYQKFMITRIQTIPRVKEMREAFEEIKTKPIQNYFKRSEGVTKFSQNLKKFQEYINGANYIGDKLCMAALRELLDMKMLQRC